MRPIELKQSRNVIILDDLRKLARNEATHKEIYLRLAKYEKNQKLRNHFLKLASFDAQHSKVWSSISGDIQEDVSIIKVAFFLLIRFVFGAVFAVKLLERGEEKAVLNCGERLNRDTNQSGRRADVQNVIDDEIDNEAAVVRTIKSTERNYMGPVVLGLNDALVELIGVIAGLVSAISNNLFIGFSGFVVGMASALSMAASYYLSNDLTEVSKLESIKGGIYTGTSYFFTTLLLVGPFFVLSNRFLALGFSLAFAVSVICIVAFFSAVVNDRPFGRNIAKMLLLGIGVAVMVYFVSSALSMYFGIKV